MTVDTNTPEADIHPDRTELVDRINKGLSLGRGDDLVSRALDLLVKWTRMSRGNGRCTPRVVSVDPADLRLPEYRTIITRILPLGKSPLAGSIGSDVARFLIDPSSRHEHGVSLTGQGYFVQFRII